MKHTALFILLILFVWPALSQPKTRGRVKRKYRDVERLQEILPEVIFRGMVRNAARIPIPGASVEIEGLKRLVHTNEYGRFMLTSLLTGRLRIRISCLGYQTKTIDFMLQEGYNDHNVTLDRSRVSLETVVSAVHNREQHIPDIPASLSVLTRPMSRQLPVTGYSSLAVSVPGLWFEHRGAGNNGFSIHGSTGNYGIPGLSPSVAVYSDQVPLSQPEGFSPEIFDMERVEVLKGPQNILFGREALKGAVHFISRKPENVFGGYVTAGAGSFRLREVEAAINYPVLEDMFFIRAAGIYRDQNGYVKNTFGGTLNGLNTLGGRFSLRFLPAFDHKIDLQLNYRKSHEPGVAFLNRWIANEEGETGLFSTMASLNRGETLGNHQELKDISLTYLYSRDEHNYWTSVSSFRKAGNSGAWDADGTFLSALEPDYNSDNQLFFQEIRYNFMRRSRLNGSAGVSYLHEKIRASRLLFSNDQHIFYILADSGNFVMPGESAFPIQPQPLNSDPMAGFQLSGDHHEAISYHRKTRSAQVFSHLTYQWKRRLFFVGGIRVFYDRLQLINDSVFSGGEASSLGQFTGAAPNLLFSPSASEQLTKNCLAFTGQAGLTYRLNENFNFFLYAVRGRKPQVLQISTDGQSQIADAEKVNSLEAGWKTTIRKRVFWEVTGFYRRHINVQTIQWYGGEDAGLIAAGGKATSYGVETGMKAALTRGLDVFGNYAWLRCAFDSTGVDGNAYPYAGNSFALTPEHSFSAGINANLIIARTMRLFATPWYIRKSRFWFNEANARGLEQAACGLLNLNCGIEFEEADMVLSVYGTNLLAQRYISDAGHLAGLPGLPVFIPGAPRMAGIRVTWNF